MRQLHEKSDHSRIRPGPVEKLQKIPSSPEAANNPQEMAFFLVRLHPPTGDRHSLRHRGQNSGQDGIVCPD
jgi:hypothetical protein